jgi:hypothetical protein
MDNIIKPYQESESESSNESSEEEILSGNLGIQYGKNDLKNVKLMDGTNANDYEELRNRFFTSHLQKVRILVDQTSGGSGYSTASINLQDEYGIECKNVIGFRLLRYSVKRKNATLNPTTPFADLTIPEIPHKACKITKGGGHIIYRMTLLNNNTSYYTDEINDELEIYYFNPINLQTITMNLPDDALLYFTFEFEITMLNL